MARNTGLVSTAALFLMISNIMVIDSVPVIHSLHKRGIPIGGGGGGGSSYNPYDHSTIQQQLQRTSDLAEWSASNAVSSAVANDYSNQLATTAQFVAQFTAPVTKEQAGRVFDTISRFQKASQVSQALAHSSQPVHRAASGAAKHNYQQAYQAQQLGYHRGSNNNNYGGGGKSSNNYDGSSSSYSPSAGSSGY